MLRDGLAAGRRPHGPLADPAPAALALPGPLVIFADQDGIGAALADLATASSIPVIEVVASTQLRRDGRRMMIDPAVPEHYREVFAAVDAPGPLHVVHLWSLLATSDRPLQATEDELRCAIRHGFDSLMLAVQCSGSSRTAVASSC